jgi:hypothetical protein
MKIKLLTAILLLWGCVAFGGEVQDKVASFTLECIKNGNPMSDEEPEDLIKECKRTAFAIYCVVNWAGVPDCAYKKKAVVPKTCGGKDGN